MDSTETEAFHTILHVLWIPLGLSLNKSLLIVHYVLDTESDAMFPTDVGIYSSVLKNSFLAKSASKECNLDLASCTSKLSWYADFYVPFTC